MALSVANVYPAGTQVRITASFENEDGDAADPDSAAFVVEHPDGSDITLSWPDDNEIDHDGTGILSLAVIYTDAGRYDFTVTGTGAVVAVGEGSFVIRPTRLEA